MFNFLRSLLQVLLFGYFSRTSFKSLIPIGLSFSYSFSKISSQESFIIGGSEIGSGGSGIGLGGSEIKQSTKHLTLPSSLTIKVVSFDVLQIWHSTLIRLSSAYFIIFLCNFSFISFIYYLVNFFPLNTV